MPNYNINVENFIGNGRIRIGGSYADNPTLAYLIQWMDKININQGEDFFTFCHKKHLLPQLKVLFYLMTHQQWHHRLLLYQMLPRSISRR